jgi:hypothetical protein
MSFSAREVEVLDTLLAVLQRGGDARVLARTPEIGNILRKVRVSRVTIDARRRFRQERGHELGRPDLVRREYEARAKAPVVR